MVPVDASELASPLQREEAAELLNALDGRAVRLCYATALRV